MTKQRGSYQRQLRDWKHRGWKKKRSEDAAYEEALERERVRRDARVTAEHGESGHRSCGKKYRYGSEAEALSAATRRVMKGAPMLRAYRCGYCDGWHLTKKPVA